MAPIRIITVCAIFLLGVLEGTNVASAFTASPKTIQHRSPFVTIAVPKPTSHAIPTTTATISSSCLHQSTSNEEEKKLPMLLDVGTKGGALFLSFVLFLVPILGYNFVTGVLGYDEIEAGKWIGVGFTVVTTLLWASTYIFRVATKDMTYVSNAEKHKSEQNFLLVDAATEHSHIFFLSHFFPA
uniref:Uncharacterized protein n=1 Tax=Ditylum brightwellii TaxID=49249 RepID=A0A6S8ZD07_9STRA|mmetsp:Transcript_19029/g.28397  ORF Transcript_19029/g.28397 Transcript_19029/m.28397 type:complete len:184 (+) Transcript_19029:105-656(+)